MNPYKRIENLEQQLEDARNEITRLEHDQVSGILGRSAFERHLLGTFKNRRRPGDHLPGIILADIDHFKKVNDEHGHLVGDKVLHQVALAIKGCVRTTDIVARYGGEEFVCILNNASHATLALVSERIRQAVDQTSVMGLPTVTVSVGFASQLKEDLHLVQTGWDVVQRADMALYRAKNQGRNRVEGDTLTYDEVKMLVEIERRRR